MQPNEMKEVDFYTYCKTCQYKNAQESEEPCCYCVAEPVNQWSHKPTKWKERKNVKLKEARKEAAAANKRYKQLKKEFDQYRNKHSAKIRELEQQIEAMNAHTEEN